MALGYSIKRRGSAGDLAFRVVDVTLDNAYAAGGYDLDERSLGFGSSGVIHFVLAAGRGGFLFDWNPSTGKLMVRDASGAAGAASPEVGNANANINNLVVRLLVFGDGHG